MTPEPTRSADLPATLARLPAFIAGRYGQGRSVGRCTSGSADAASPPHAGIGWMTASELQEHVEEVSLGLMALGVTSGDRVAILAESRPEWLVCDFGVLAAGGVSTPLYPTLAAEQIAFILRDSEARVVCCSTVHQLEKVLSVAASLPTLTAVVLSLIHI